MKSLSVFLFALALTILAGILVISSPKTVQAQSCSAGVCSGAGTHNPSCAANLDCNWSCGFNPDGSCWGGGWDGPDCGKCNTSTTPPGGSVPPTGGNCSVSWTLSNENPAPNSNINVVVRGESGSWQNVHLNLDGNRVEGGSVVEGGSNPRYSYSVNSGSAGAHALTFTQDNGGTTCSPAKTFTTQAASSPPPSSGSNGLGCTIEGPSTIQRGGEKVYYEAKAAGPKVKKLLPAYTFVDTPGSGDWKLFNNIGKSCLSGNCLGELDPKTLPPTLTKFTVVCNAFNVDREDPYAPPGVDKTVACTGNPLAIGKTFEDPFVTSGGSYTDCGTNSRKQVTIKGPCSETGDFNGDGTLNIEDFNVWKTNFLNNKSVIAGCGGMRADWEAFIVWRTKMAEK